MAKAPTQTLEQYMDGLVRALCDLAPKALARAQRQPIHHARVTTRRLKAAVDLLKPELSSSCRKPLQRTLRKLRRELGPLRDLDVMLGHLVEFPDTSKYPLALKWLRAQLTPRRRAQSEESARSKAAGTAASQLGEWDDLRQEVHSLEGAVPALLAGSLAEQLKDFARRAESLSGTGHAPSRHNQDPHALRIAGKLLRYTLEIAVATGHPLPEAHLKTFKRLQDALGLWHDYVVLMNTAMQAAIETDLAAHSPDTHRQLLQLINAASKQSQDSLAHFRSLWSRHAAELVRDIGGLSAACRVSAAVCTGKR